VDVLSVAREPGKVTKVLVHSDLQVDPIQLCAGPRRERLPLISHDLSPDETIDFVPWNPDPHLNVVSALTPLHADDVVSVRLAPNGLSATVVVRSSAAARRAVGTEGVNLRVAERLLGIHIDLETREAPIPPQEEVAAVLAYRIPEIERNEISVVGIARRVGRACKIAVTSPTGASLHRACIGPGGATVSAISKDLGNEQVSFVFWDPSRMERCIVDALFPLRRQEVTSTHYDSVARHAIVTVRGSSSSRKAIGRDGDNVRLAEEICGVRIEIRRA
jgi:transcription antitermination factor NusA-like protein